MTEHSDATERSSPSRSLLCPWLFLAAAAQGACADGLPPSFPFAAEAGAAAAFSDVFEVVDTMALEERDDVIIANPSVTFDGEHLVMSDMYAFQARVYATSGELLWAGGRRGSGPGEFTGPVMARRDRAGRIVVLDLTSSRATTFDLVAGTEPTVVEVPFLVTDQWDLDEGRKLVVGDDFSSESSDSSRPLLHVWNPVTRDVESSFFDPAYPEPVAPWWRSAYADAKVARDTIWATSSLSDSIYMFALDGSPVGSIPIPMSKQVDTRDPSMLWEIASFWFLEDGDFAVRIQTMEWETQEFTYYLAIIDREGNAKALLSNTPQLHVVGNDLFYFQNPDHMEPNQWIVARLRSGT